MVFAVSTAAHAEMVQYLQDLVSEHTDDLHHERFFAKPAGLFVNMWEAVLMRDELDHAGQAWRARR